MTFTKQITFTDTTYANGDRFLSISEHRQPMPVRITSIQNGTVRIETENAGRFQNIMPISEFHRLVDRGHYQRI